MDCKKETERSELHRTIWSIANDLRGSVDGWDFKQYVLGMLFYRYISENLSDFINRGEAEAGNPDFRYEYIPDGDAEIQGIVKCEQELRDRIDAIVKELEGGH